MQSVTAIVKEPQIKLSRFSGKKFGKLFKKYQKQPNQELKVQMLNIFKNQLELKAAAAAANNHNVSALDYLETLYIKFLEILDSLTDKGGYVVKALTDALNESKPSKYDTKFTDYVELRNITPKEEYNKFSYEIDNKTLKQKAENIINYTKSEFKDIETKVLSMFLEGSNFDEIAHECNISTYKAEHIYERAIKKLNNPELKDKYSHIFYEDTIPGSYHERLEDISIDIIKEILNDLVKKHGYTVKRIFRKNSNNEKGLNFINQTGLLLKINLPERYNTPEFKKMAEEISKETFGRNIFQFLN